MDFDKNEAQKNLSYILDSIGRVERSLEDDILRYRSHDTIDSQDDEFRTMRDIRFYTLRAYEDLDKILNFLDKYK